MSKESFCYGHQILSNFCSVFEMRLKNEMQSDTSASWRLEVRLQRPKVVTMLSRAGLLAGALGALQGVPPSLSNGVPLRWCRRPAPQWVSRGVLTCRPHTLRGAAGREQRGDQAAMLFLPIRLASPPDPRPARCLTARYPSPIPPTAGTRSASPAACAAGAACPGPRDPSVPTPSVLPPCWSLIRLYRLAQLVRTTNES